MAPTTIINGQTVSYNKAAACVFVPTSNILWMFFYFLWLQNKTAERDHPHHRKPQPSQPSPPYRRITKPDRTSGQSNTY